MLHAVLPLVDVRPVTVDADVLAALSRAETAPLPAMFFGHDARLRIMDASKK
jgi:hypothetical protein